MSFGIGTQLKIRGMDRVNGLMRWGASESPEAAGKGVKRGAVLLENHMRKVSYGGQGPRNRTLDPRTSTLRRTVSHTQTPDGLTAWIGPRSFYALTHEGLTKGVQGDHVVIKPVRAKVLAFEVEPSERVEKTWTNSGGQQRRKMVRQKRGKKRMVFARSVRIPIRRPIAYTYEQEGRNAQAEIAKTLRREMPRP
jgi:hypothetical protein